MRGLYIFIFLLISCNTSEKVIVKLKVINELQDCEENNIFYRIIESDNTVEFKNKGDSLVLILFADSINSQKNYDFFFPSSTIKRYEIVINGFFEKDKVDFDSYGCKGSRKFRVVEVVKIEDVTNKKKFTINYR